MPQTRSSNMSGLGASERPVEADTRHTMRAAARWRNPPMGHSARCHAPVPAAAAASAATAALARRSPPAAPRAPLPARRLAAYGPHAFATTVSPCLWRCCSSFFGGSERRSRRRRGGWGGPGGDFAAAGALACRPCPPLPARRLAAYGPRAYPKTVSLCLWRCCSSFCGGSGRRGRRRRRGEREVGGLVVLFYLAAASAGDWHYPEEFRRSAFGRRAHAPVGL